MFTSPIGKNDVEKFERRGCNLAQLPWLKDLVLGVPFSSCCRAAWLSDFNIRTCIELRLCAKAALTQLRSTRLPVPGGLVISRTPKG